MKKEKQLDYQLHCKATAALEAEILNELGNNDKSLASILSKKEEENETKDSTETNNREMLT